MSRAAAICRLSVSPNSLSAYIGPETHELVNLDLCVRPVVMNVVEALAGCERSEVSACSLSVAYSHWLPKWVTRCSPLWHTNEHRTVSSERVTPGFCPFCLFEDVEDQRSQYVRLSWYCAVTTVCPVHKVELITCCAGWRNHSSVRVRHQTGCKRMRCIACGFAFDARNPSAASTAQIALARFENTLRNSISKDNVFGIRQETGCLRFAQDVAWALMRPACFTGTRYRVAHFFEGSRFSMPSIWR